MFTLDEKIRSLPAAPDQVLALLQSINAPHLAIPGKQAGPAQAFIVTFRSGQGVAVVVYLALSESSDCAVYVSDRGAVPLEEQGGEEAEAMGFVESMGFMMDNLNYGSLAPEDQEPLLKTLAPFRKEGAKPPPPPPAALKPDLSPGNAALARLLSSF